MVNAVQYNHEVHCRSNKFQISWNKKKTSEEWKTIWLNKFDRIAAQEGINPEKSARMRRIIDDYLLNNPGAPYFIKTENFTEYFQKSDRFQQETIRFLYDKVAQSPKYRGLIEKHISDPEILHSSLPTQSVEPAPIFDNPYRNSLSEKSEAISSTAEESTTYESENTLKNQVAFPKDTRVELLQKLKLEIDSRNLSKKTLYNYLGAVSRFINHLTPESNKD